ncbi:MAG: hypothetical protein AAF541_06720 [Pseudomonadota bacterium]
MKNWFTQSIWLGAAALVSTMLLPAQANAFDCDTTLQDLCTLPIAPEGGAALALRAPGKQFTFAADGTGFEISGTVELLSSSGATNGYTVYEAALVAQYTDPSNPDSGFRRLHGSAMIEAGREASTSPGLGMLTAEAGYSRRVNLGLELGSLLQQNLQIAYLNPNRPCQGLQVDDPGFKECPYWFFQYVEEIGAALGFGGTDIGLNITADTSAENKVLYVMDPDDFFVYAGVTFGLLDSVQFNIESTAAEPEPELESSVDYGLGFSQQGYIPFQVLTTYGIEDYVDTLNANFEGHMVLNWVDLPVFALVSLDGDMVMRFPTDSTTGEHDTSTYQAAANGIFNVGLSTFGGGLGISTQLSNASAGLRINSDEQSIYMSGEVGKTFPWKPEAFPVEMDAASVIRGVVVLANTQDPASGEMVIAESESFAQLDGQFLIDASFNGQNGALGGELYAEGFTRLDAKQGYEFFGAMGAEGEATLIHPLIQADAGTAVTVRWNAYEFTNSVIEMRGGFGVGGDTFSQQGIFRATPTDAYLGFPLSFDPTLVQQAYEDVQDDTAEAEAEVTRLNGVIAQQRSVVQAERDAQQATLNSALADLSAAQAEVNRLNALITKYNKDIAYYKGRIGSWYRWYRKQPWYKRAKAYSRYLSKKAYYNGLIASRKVAIAGVNTAKGAATFAVSVASASVNVARAAVVTTPIDLDPRVGPVIVARDVALASLNALQSIMPEIPTIPGTIQATAGYRVNGSGLVPEARAEYCSDQDCTEIRDGFYDESAGRACINLPEEGNPQVCTAIPEQT